MQTDNFEKTYFAAWIRLDGNDTYFVWYDGEPDGVIVENHSLPTFETLDALFAFMESRQLTREIEEPILQDFDVLARWLKKPRKKTVDCKTFLNSCNMFGDVSASLGKNFDPNEEKTRTVYEKLFCGCNIPAVTPPGENYTPIWRKREIRQMQKILKRGLRMFRKAVKPN